MTPLRSIRKHCLDCCGGRPSVVKYCTCDGVNSTRCHLWPFRFGKRPATAAKKHGERFLDPRQMPSAEIPQEEVESGGRPGGRSGELSKKKRSTDGNSDGQTLAAGQ